jgi:hypothetical protein
LALSPQKQTVRIRTSLRRCGQLEGYASLLCQPRTSVRGTKHAEMLGYINCPNPNIDAADVDMTESDSRSRRN